jgi:hypothetical protein
VIVISLFRVGFIQVKFGLVPSPKLGRGLFFQFGGMGMASIINKGGEDSYALLIQIMRLTH